MAWLILRSASVHGPQAAGGCMLLWACLCMAGCQPQNGAATSAIGKKLPSLKLQALTGDSTSVQLEDLQGKVAVVNFWGTWCPPCVREFPHMEELANRHAENDNFRLLAISCMPQVDPDLDELREETEAFLDARRSKLATYADDGDQTRTAVKQVAGWRGYPTTVIVDKQGVIQGVWVGYTEGVESDMALLVEKLLVQ